MLWQRLTVDDRIRLGGNLKTAFVRDPHPAQIWMRLRGVSFPRAIVDVNKKLGLISEEEHRSLLQEIGEPGDDPDEAIEQAVSRGDLVLVERPRTAYWQRKPIRIDWDKRQTPWNFFWELCSHAKAGQPVDQFNFGESAGPDTSLSSRRGSPGFGGFRVAWRAKSSAAGSVQKGSNWSVSGSVYSKSEQTRNCGNESTRLSAQAQLNESRRRRGQDGTVPFVRFSVPQRAGNCRAKRDRRKSSPSTGEITARTVRPTVSKDRRTDQVKPLAMAPRIRPTTLRSPSTRACSERHLRRRISTWELNTKARRLLKILQKRGTFYREWLAFKGTKPAWCDTLGPSLFGDVPASES